ncbi:MAG: hypothetical protein ACJ8DZ_01995 [Allosphingosinicella sp.]
MSRGLAQAFTVVALFFAAHTEARAQEVPSCYAAARLGIAPPRPVRSVFVIVDQTTALDGEMRRMLEANLQRLLSSGASFSIATFSAFSRGHYTTVLSSGAIEGAVPEGLRPSLSVVRLNALDRCLARQQQYAWHVAARALARAMSVPATTFSNSEIMASLAQLSDAVRAAPSANRVVIVASDLMEHSSATSFYAHRTLRTIDPAAEMKNAVGLGLTGDFGGARVYVVGAGLLPPEAGASVRNVSALNALVGFWTAWFRHSNARSATIGRPNVVTPIQ